MGGGGGTGPGALPDCELAGTLDRHGDLARGPPANGARHSPPSRRLGDWPLVTTPSPHTGAATQVPLTLEIPSLHARAAEYDSDFGGSVERRSGRREERKNPERGWDATGAAAGGGASAHGPDTPDVPRPAPRLSAISELRELALAVVDGVRAWVCVCMQQAAAEWPRQRAKVKFGPLWVTAAEWPTQLVAKPAVQERSAVSVEEVSRHRGMRSAPA